MENTQYYWEIIERDGTKTQLSPTGAERAKALLAKGQPINLRTKSIPAHQIVKFYQTKRPYGEQLALEEGAAQAFHDAVEIEDGGEVVVAARWVKKEVSFDRWTRYYSATPGYKLLGNSNDAAVIAFRVPVHLIDRKLTPYCTDSEVEFLENS